MAKLPASWDLPAKEQAIPKGTSMYQRITMNLVQFNALYGRSTLNLGGRGTTADAIIILTQVAQQNWVSKQGNFVRLRKESGLQWIQSAQIKLD